MAYDIATVFGDALWLERGLLTQVQQEKVRNFLLASSDICAPQGVCVFDLTTANAVICNSDYNRIYLLDLEAANIAPVPYYQLACVASDKGPASVEFRAFFDGYKCRANEADTMDSELSRLTLYRMMRATAWARDRAPRLLDANNKRTRSVLEAMLRQSAW